MVLFGPRWFLGGDILFELVFALITLGISAYSFKLAKIARNKSYFIFSAGFLLLSAGYGVRTLFNFLIYYDLIPRTALTTDWIHFAGFYMSSILLLGGLVLLLSTVFRVRDIRPTIILYFTSIIAFLFSNNRPVLLFLLSFLFLSMIIYHHAKNFWHNGNGTAFMVLSAFVLVLIGQLNFLFRFNPLFYVFGHIAELLGYIILLFAIIKISRK